MKVLHFTLIDRSSGEILHSSSHKHRSQFDDQKFLSDKVKLYSDCFMRGCRSIDDLEMRLSFSTVPEPIKIPF